MCNSEFTKNGNQNSEGTITTAKSGGLGIITKLFGDSSYLPSGKALMDLLPLEE